tara:strand:- start:1565 stop:1867 length:303 start_codon:yes stop_codon:yes gene_type:complete
MIVKFIEVYSNKSFSNKTNEGFSLREVYINPKHIVCIRVNEAIGRRVYGSPLGEEILKGQKFTKISLNRGQSGIDLDVVGDVSHVQEKLYENERLNSISN